MSPSDPRDRRLAVLLALVALLVYNANLRSIAAGDTYPARFIPLAVWGDGTVYLDPVLEQTIQAHPEPYWIRETVNGHKASMYPVVTPLLVTPLYLPAALDLFLHNWTEPRMDRLALVMEKISASIVASLAVGWMYLLLRRRIDRRHAALLTGLFAFGTSTWATSSQALWQHGPAELFCVAALWFLTSPPTARHALAAGLATGLLVANRPPDLPLALAFGVAALFWAGRRIALSALFALAAALPMALTVIYNEVTFGQLAGGYGQAGVVTRSFFSQSPVEGLAGLLVSPSRGLFVYSPFLLFLPLYFRRALRDPSHRMLTLCLAAGVLLLLLLYSTVDFLQGAVYGPRFLTDALPILVWMLAPVLPTLGRVSRVVFAAAGVFAIHAQLVGAFFYSGASNHAFAEELSGPGARRRAWSLRHSPILVEARNPRQPAVLYRALRELDQPAPPPPPPRVGPLSDFHTVVPCRIADTRSGAALVSGPPRKLQIAGAGCGVPVSAVAVAVNATILGESGQGLVLLLPEAGRGRIETIYEEGRYRSLQILFPLAPDGSILVVVQGQGRAQLVLDVSGYFAPVAPAPVSSSAPPR